MDSNDRSNKPTRITIILSLVIVLCGVIIILSYIPVIQDIIYSNTDSHPDSIPLKLTYYSTSNGHVTCNETRFTQQNQSLSFPTTQIDTDDPQCAKVICTLNPNGTISTTMNHDSISELTNIFTEQDTQPCNCSGIHYLSRHGKINFNIWGYCCIECV